MSERFGKAYAVAIRADREHRAEEQKRKRRSFLDGRDTWAMLDALALCQPSEELHQTLAKLSLEDQVIAIRQATLPIPHWVRAHLERIAFTLANDKALPRLPAGQRNARIAEAFGLAGQGKPLNGRDVRREAARKLVAMADKLIAQGHRGPEFSKKLGKALDCDSNVALRRLRLAQKLLGLPPHPSERSGRPRKELDTASARSPKR